MTSRIPDSVTGQFTSEKSAAALTRSCGRAGGAIPELAHRVLLATQELGGANGLPFFSGLHRCRVQRYFLTAGPYLLSTLCHEPSPFIAVAGLTDP